MQYKYINSIFERRRNVKQSIKYYGSLPDIIILDVNMPVMDGLECLRNIRLTPALNNIPVVMLTTSSSRITIEATYRAGANLFVKKPIDLDDLETIIQSLLQMDWSQNTCPIELDNYVYKPTLKKR